jgi:hypothetical protein
MPSKGRGVSDLREYGIGSRESRDMFEFRELNYEAILTAIDNNLTISAVLMIVVHCGFALGIWSDARRRVKKKSLYFVGPILWALTVLLGGLFPVAIYWAMHYSTLERRQSDAVDKN